MHRYNELYHTGVLGMRWGVRRYQNKDGTLTDAGIKRYDRDKRENVGKAKRDKVGQANPKRWVKEDIERTKKATDLASNLFNQASRVSKETSSLEKTKLDLHKMTDQQLRDRINRTFLEKQYNVLFAPPATVSKGKQYASKILEVAGTTLTIGSSALGIVLAIKELRG